MVLGRDTFAGDVLARLGVDNVYAHHADRYPRVPLPELRAAAPDLVILPDEPYRFTADDGPEAFEGVPCALVDGRLLTWYGPSLAQAPSLLGAARCEQGPRKVNVDHERRLDARTCEVGALTVGPDGQLWEQRVAGPRAERHPQRQACSPPCVSSASSGRTWPGRVHRRTMTAVSSVAPPGGMRSVSTASARVSGSSLPGGG